MATAKKVDRFVLIGAGRVGTAVGHILEREGVEVVAVASRSEESLKQASKFISKALFTPDAVKAAKRGNVIIITTPDDLIADTCLLLVTEKAINKGDYVVHIEYGIGRYHGMVQKTIGHLTHEYLEIEYAAGGSGCEDGMHSSLANFRRGQGSGEEDARFGIRGYHTRR